MTAPIMTAPILALDAKQSEAILLNARRYGLSQENLTQFSALLNTMRGQQATNSAPATTEETAPEPSYSDLIKNYVKQRMTDRMQSAIQDDARSQAAYGHYAQPNAQDFLLNNLGTPGTQRQSSNDISNLLNMHFDLNTLQMLP